MYDTSNLARSQQPSLIKAGPSTEALAGGRSLTTYHISLQNLFNSGREYRWHRLICYEGGGIVELEAQQYPRVPLLPVATVGRILHCSEGIVDSLLKAGILTARVLSYGALCVDSASVDKCKSEYGAVESGRWVLYTVAKVACLLNCSVPDVHALIERGILVAKGPSPDDTYVTRESLHSCQSERGSVLGGETVNGEWVPGQWTPNDGWAVISSGPRSDGSSDDDSSSDTVAKRGKISRYSHRSRHRMVKSFSRLNRSRLQKPKMLSLMFPAHGKYSDNPIEWKKMLDAFIERHLKVELPGDFFIFWKMEPQKRGAPHFHLLIFSDDSKTLARVYQWREKWKKAWYELVGSDDPHHRRFGAWVGFGGHKDRRVQDFRNWGGVAFYLVKYLGKTTSDGWNGFQDRHGVSIRYPGRFWGIYNRKFYRKFVDPVPLYLSPDQFDRVKLAAIDKAVVDLQGTAESLRFKMTPAEREELPIVEAAIDEGFRSAEASTDKTCSVVLEVPDSYHFRRYVNAYKQAKAFRARQLDTAGLSAFLDSDLFLATACETFEWLKVKLDSRPPRGGPPIRFGAENRSGVAWDQLFLPYGEEAVADAVSAYYSVGGTSDV